MTELTAGSYNPRLTDSEPSGEHSVLCCLKNSDPDVGQAIEANGRDRSDARARAAHERPLRFASADDGPNAECWQLNQRCFWMAKPTADTFEYLLGSPNPFLSRVTQNSSMAGFVIGLLEPTTRVYHDDRNLTHIAAGVGKLLNGSVEDGFRRRSEKSRAWKSGRQLPAQNFISARLQRYATTAEILFKWRGWLVDGEAARLNLTLPQFR